MLRAACSEPEYGRTDGGAGKRYNVEFVSANPTGPMHMGNARGGALGDCLAACLDWAGYDVTREFYINDAGNQIEKFGKSLAIRYLQLYKGEDACPLPEECYQGADIVEHAKNFAAEHGDAYVDGDFEQLKKDITAFALPKNIEGAAARPGQVPHPVRRVVPRKRPARRRRGAGRGGQAARDRRVL